MKTSYLSVSVITRSILLLGMYFFSVNFAFSGSLVMGPTEEFCAHFIPDELTITVEAGESYIYNSYNLYGEVEGVVFRYMNGVKPPQLQPRTIRYIDSFPLPTFEGNLIRRGSLFTKDAQSNRPAIIKKLNMALQYWQTEGRCSE